MTQREKTLAVGLVVLVGLGVCAGALFFFALEPYREASANEERAIAFLREEEGKLAAEKAQIDAVFKIDPRLIQWNEISLPPVPRPRPGQTPDDVKTKHLRDMNVLYEQYLSAMLTNNRFKTDSISVQMSQVEKLAVAKGKQPTYERVAFRISGRGELSSVTGFTEEFHKSPLLHQLRVLTIEVPATRSGAKAVEGELEMKATVEALLVTGAKRDEKAGTGLLPTKLPFALRVMADPPRSYYAMTSKNMFFGIKPPEKKPEKKPDPPKVDKETKEPPRERPEDVLAFVKLTMLCYDTDGERWYATMYDQLKGGAERKLAKAVKGADKMDELVFYDRYDRATLDATVVHVDGQQLVFKVEKEKKYYRVKIGEFLYPIYPKQPMTSSELKELGISAQ